MERTRRVEIVGWALAVVFASAMAGGVAGCEEDEEPAEEMTRLLSVEVSHDVVLPTSEVRVDLGGTGRMEAQRADVVLAGSVDGRQIEESFDVELNRDGDVGDLYFELAGDEVLWPKLEPGDAADFRGAMLVRIEDVLGVAGEGELEELSWRFVRELAPEIELDVPSTVFPNATARLDASGVLRPDEGKTVAVLEQGVFEADDDHSFELSGQQLPVEWTGDRHAGALHFDPDVVGVHPGRLEAEVRFENRFDDGTTLESDGAEQRLDTELETSFIADISPEEASRGQLVDIEGRGFVDGTEAEHAGMLLRFEGVLTPSDPDEQPREFEGASAVERVPYSVESDEKIAQDVWYEVVDRQLEGLGATPGVFEGSVTPVMFDEHDQLEGIGWQGQFEVLPTRQVVYLKYLPAFSVALGEYGLVNVEREIRERILEVVQRDYADFNVEFVDEPPDNFADYATVEMGGPDPTGGMTFGVDNTYEGQAKDTGNLHLDSYLGGINRETAEQLGTPFGGVFVESFAIFSEALHPEMSQSTERFDDIFGPFMPELDGDEVLATEWPDGERADDIEKAIRVFGNVVGNTVSHEVGHALGMTHFEEDWENPELHIFHNTDPGGYIMDAGVDRSFEQRAEIDGEGPMEFNDQNRAYLEEILPLGQ